MSESALVRAVVTRIRAHATVSDHECDMEIDERAPSVAPDRYIIVMPGGVVAGPGHDPSGGVIDKVYSVDVVMALRNPKKPRDRTREMWTGFRGVTAIALDSFEQTQEVIEEQIDFRYETNDIANDLINQETSVQDPTTSAAWVFTEPLRFADAGPIREAPAEIFAGTGGGAIAFVRTIRFRGARRQVVRS